MIFEICPVMDIWNLTTELFDVGIIENDAAAELADYLFGDEYMNDSYKSFYIHEEYDEPYWGEPWQNYDNIQKNNAIRKYLRERLPVGTKKIVIDVSW